MAPLITPRVKTPEAVDQDKQGTRTTGFGQLEAASEAICCKSSCLLVETIQSNEK